MNSILLRMKSDRMGHSKRIPYSRNTNKTVYICVYTFVNVMPVYARMPYGTVNPVFFLFLLTFSPPRISSSSEKRLLISDVPFQIYSEVRGFHKYYYFLQMDLLRSFLMDILFSFRKK